MGSLTRPFQVEGACGIAGNLPRQLLNLPQNFWDRTRGESMPVGIVRSPRDSGARAWAFAPQRILAVCRDLSLSCRCQPLRIGVPAGPGRAAR
jgi:hypothetical protein